MKIFINERVELDGSDWIPADLEDFQQNIAHLLKIFNIISYIPDVDVYYSGEAFNRLLNNIQGLLKWPEYAMNSPVTRLRQSLYELSAINWDDELLSDFNYSYYIQTNMGGGTPININNTTVAECSEHAYRESNAFLINLHSSAFNDETPLHINRSKNTIPPVQSIIRVECFSQPALIVSYIIKSRQERSFNVSKKHGENGKGAQPNDKGFVSSLECSREEAHDLLKIAIGLRSGKELYSYDIKKEKFIVFKFEGETPQNQFHGYHANNQREIPEKIKKFWLEEYYILLGDG